LNLRLQLAKAGEDFGWRAVRDFFVDDFLVAVDGEVVALRGDVGLGDKERLLGAFAGEFAAVVGGFSAARGSRLD
jgi:hypothetical protein